MVAGAVPVRFWPCAGCRDKVNGVGFTPSRPHTTQSAFSGQTLSRMFSFGVPGGGRFRRGGGEEVPALVPGVLIGGTDEAEVSPISGTRAVGWSGRPGVG